MAPQGGPGRKVTMVVASCATMLVLSACSGAGPESATPGSSPMPSPSLTSAGPTPSALAGTVPNASTSLPTEASTPASASPAPTFSLPDAAYLRDGVSYATFTLIIDRGDLQYGLVSIAIPKLGLLWTTVPATLDSHGDGSIEATYKGVGELDRAATLDLDYGILSQRSGSSDSVEISLRASIGPNHRTGTVAATVAGHGYAITDRAPTETAEAALDAMVIAIRKEDWGGWYELLSSTVARSFSEAEWVAMMQAGMVPYGSVVDAAAGPLTYRNDAYLDVAEAPFSITVDKDGARRKLDYTVSLVWENSAWRFVSSTPPPPP